MMNRDYDTALILALISTTLVVMVIGFTEVLARLRPRVIYVYQEPDAKDDIPIWGKRDLDGLREREPEHRSGLASKV